MSLYDDALWIITPNQYVSGSLYALKPVDGSGDLFVDRSSYANRVSSNRTLDYVSDNVPRLDYSNGSCPEILIEPQRTNIALYSEKLINGYAFSYTDGTFIVSENTTNTLDPAGGNNADKFTVISGVNINDCYTVTSGTGKISFSIFVKKGTNNQFQLYHQNVNTGNTFSAIFNVGSGRVTSTSGTVVAKVENYNNGWYRCIISGADTSSLGNIFRVQTYPGTTFLFGLGIEQGGYATSYIPTTDKAATRIYDNIRNINTSSLIGQNEGTFYFELDVVDYANSGNPVLYYINNNSLTNLTYAQINEAGFVEFVSPNYYLYWGGLTNGKHKIAVAHTIGDAVLYVDGVQKDFKFYADTSNVYDIFGLGYTNPSFIGKTFFGNIMFLPNRISDIELAQLTTL